MNEGLPNDRQAGDYLERVGLGLHDEAAKRKIELRLFGSIGVRVRCHRSSWVFSAGRKYKDIDIVALSKQRSEVRRLFADLNFELDPESRIVFEDRRYFFFHKTNAVEVEVFFDQLNFCHKLDLRARLCAENSPSLALADLLLSKLQKIDLSQTDVEDICALLSEYTLGDSDSNQINLGYVARLLSRDWGFWYTVTENLTKLRSENAVQQNNSTLRHVEPSLTALVCRLAMEEKSCSWKLRATIGPRIRWYQPVEEDRIF